MSVESTRSDESRATTAIATNGSARAESRSEGRGSLRRLNGGAGSAGSSGHPGPQASASPASLQAGAPQTGFAREFHHFVDQATRSGKDAPLALKDWRDLAEAWRISQALRSCAGNRSAAARELGIGRRTLYAKMDKLGIEPRW